MISATILKAKSEHKNEVSFPYHIDDKEYWEARLEAESMGCKIHAEPSGELTMKLPTWI